MDRSWIDGRFGKPVVMSAVVITAALIALAIIATDDNDNASADSGTTPASERTGGSTSGESSPSGKPSPSRPSGTPGSSGSRPSGSSATTGTGSPGLGSSGSGSGSSPPSGNGSTGSTGSTNGRTSPNTSPKWTDDLPSKGTYGKTAQDQDRRYLESIPLTPENLPSEGHTWGQADRADIGTPGSGRVGSVPHRGRSLVTTSCSPAPQIERVTTMSEIYESDTGFAVADMTIVTKSAADARGLYHEMTSEKGVECAADAAADAVSETWGWDIDRVRAIPIDEVNVTGSEDRSVRYTVVAYDAIGTRRQVEFTTTTARTGRTILVVLTAAESRIPGTMIDEIAESRSAAIYT